MEVSYLIDKKADILNSGRALFLAKGYKNTKISDISKMAGIGAGTFYNYYASKEKLFLEIYIKESEDIKKSIMESIDLNNEPVTMVTKFVTQHICAMNSNLILKEWYNRDHFNNLKQYFYEEGGLTNIAKFICSGKVELNKKWKVKGKIRGDISEDLVSALLNSIIYIDIHKNEIGIQHFPQILKYITEFITEGFIEYIS